MYEGTAVVALILLLILVMLVLSIFNDRRSILDSRTISDGVSSIYLKLQFQWQRDFSLPTIDHCRLINNDGGTAEPLIDGSVLCNAI
jgi:hypothetical protein